MGIGVWCWAVALLGSADAELAIRPFIDTHCVACHGAAKQSGELRLDALQPGQEAATWESVARRVRDREMPPAKKPQPTDAQRAGFVTAVEKALGDQTPASAGRVTLRRLNRVEYANCVRDLFGTDYRPADGFPLDDVGHGFDNMGDVLSLSPLLLEKYLAAADTVLDAVFTREQRVKKTLRHFQGHEGGYEIGGRHNVNEDNQTRVFFDGGLSRVVRFEHPGEYKLRLRAKGRPADDAWPKVSFRLDGVQIAEWVISPTRFRLPGDPSYARDFVVRTDVSAGEHRLGFEVLNPKDGNERFVTVFAIEVEGPLDPPPPEPTDAYRRVTTAQPSNGLTKSEAVRTVLTTFARRAFRREPRPDELESLQRLVANENEFDAAIRLGLKAILVSPHFLFRVETDRDNAEPGRALALRDTELAARLSFFLWSTAPDDELLQLALAGRLQQGDGLRAQVRRMLGHKKARTLAENFAGQWLQFRNLNSTAVDPRTFPNFDEALRTAMAEETRLFFEAVVRDDRPITDFLHAQYTFVNERLAKHYGIRGVKGPDFRRVSLDGTRRAGVLTHASLLTVTSNPTRTSPVKRGKFLLENILGTPIPPPPPDVPDLEEGPELRGTLRQRMEAHRTNPNCASCHERMDPPGFAFENFDGIGAWRDREGSEAVDASGTLADGRSFKDAAELRDILNERRDAFRRCLAEKLLTYALGRGLIRADRAAVDEVCRRTAEGGERFSALVLAIVDSEPFRMRVSSKEPR